MTYFKRTTSFSDHFKAGLQTEHATFSDYLAAIDYVKLTAEIPAFRQQFETLVFDQVRSLSLIMYALMTRKNQYHPFTEEHVKLSMCYWYLGLSDDTSISVAIISQFYEQINSELSRQQLDRASITHLNTQLINWTITLFDQVYTRHEMAQINRISRFLGSDLFLMMGDHNQWPEIILGRGDYHMFGIYHVYTLTKELVRTPNIIIPIAAMIGQKHIFIRESALINIIHYKWKPVWTMAALPETDIFHKLGIAIKQHCIRAYQTDHHDLEQAIPLMVRDMSQTVFFHEIGHGIVQHQILNTSISAAGEALQSFTECDIVQLALHEILADLAPLTGKEFGPLVNMIRISRHNPNQATRMFWMYISDTWFFDTEDTYMYTYSDIIVSILASVIQSDNTINFELLWQLMHRPDSLFAGLIHCFTAQTREIETAMHCILQDFALTPFSEHKHQVMSHFPDLAHDAYLQELKIWTLAFESIASHRTASKSLLPLFDSHKKQLNDLVLHTLKPLAPELHNVTQLREFAVLKLQSLLFKIH